MSVPKRVMREAASHIQTVDPAFEEIISRSPLCTIGGSDASSQETHFETLVKSVVAQQVSVKAADAITAKLYRVARGEVTPARISRMRDATLRGAGLSGAKVRTIKEMGHAIHMGRVNLEELGRHPHDHLIVDELTKLWGIGRWTAEMFMMFKLHRLDVWPVGDLAMRRGWERIHGLSEQIEPSRLDDMADHLRPYRSVAAWYCWRAIETGESSSW